MVIKLKQVMEQYIPKSSLVAEIKKRKQTWQHQDQQYVNGGKDVCDYLLGFLDTLEVKEVNLEKEFDGYTKDILACDVQFEPFTHLYNCAKHFFELGLKAQKEPVSEDLEEAANTYIDNWYKVNNLDKESYPIDVEISKNDFKAGAEWGKNKAKVEIQAQSMAFAHGCPKEEPVSEELEKEKTRLFGDCKVRKGAFELGAKWKEQQMMKNSVECTVHADASGYPYIGNIELYDYENDKPLAKAGDKVKVIINN